MKGYPNGLRHLRCSLFLVMNVLLFSRFVQQRMLVMMRVEEAAQADVFSFSFFFGGKQLRKWGVFQQLWETTTEQHQRGKLAFGICCPSSQNKTRPLEVRGEEDKIRHPPA